MRLKEIFTIEEARREPARNIRYTPADIINRYANRDDVFVHFSNTPKLGMNPKSHYNTPMGLYSYPVKYVADAISRGERTLHKRVPFMSEAEYVTIFRETGDISNLCDFNHAKDLMERFELLVRDFLEQKGTMIDSVIDHELDRMKRFAKKQARVSDIKGGELWGQMYYILNEFFSSSTSSWARMFQKMDVDCVVDVCGAGIIHPSEPVQAIHFRPQQTIEVIEMMENKSAGAKNISFDQFIVDELLDKQNRVNVEYNPYEYFWDLEGYLIGDKGVTGGFFIYAFIPEQAEDVIRRIISEYPQYVQKHAAMFEMDEEEFLREFPSIIVEVMEGEINTDFYLFSKEAKSHIKMMSTLFLRLLKSVIQQLYTSILVDIYDTEMPKSIRLRIKTADKYNFPENAANESINILLDKGYLSSVEVESHTKLVERSNDEFNEIDGYIDFYVPQEVIFEKIEEKSDIQGDIFVTDITVESVAYSDTNLDMVSILDTISRRMDLNDAIVERATSFLNLSGL